MITLRDLRIAAGYGPRRFAERCGIEPSRYLGIESGCYKAPHKDFVWVYSVAEPATPAELAAIIRGLQAEPAAAWRTMETAPKDGTRILVVTDTLVEVAFWNGRVWNAENGDVALNADHWLPLPTNPRTDKE